MTGILGDDSEGQLVSLQTGKLSLSELEGTQGSASLGMVSQWHIQLLSLLFPVADIANQFLDSYLPSLVQLESFYTWCTNHPEKKKKNELGWKTKLGCYSAVSALTAGDSPGQDLINCLAIAQYLRGRGTQVYVNPRSTWSAVF